MPFQAKLCSSLAKIFSGGGLPREHNTLSLLKNEKGSLQLVLCPDRDTEAVLKVTSPLPFTLYEVREIYAGLPLYADAPNCTVLNEAAPGYYPDLLFPCGDRISCSAGKNTAVWIEFGGDKSGEKDVRIEVTCGKETEVLNARVVVSEASLPAQELKHTNWFHSDCLSVYYQVPVFSEEYWRITENFIRSAAAHGVNMLLTPVFTPALDTAVGGERPTVQLVDVTKKGYTYTFGFEKLDRWIDICRKNGIRYFEISHFFTQWGAEHAPKIMAQTSAGCRQIFGWDTKADSQGYFSFLRQFGEAFYQYTERKGITELCYVHCSDEPGLHQINQYKHANRALTEYFSAYPHLDALSDYDFYQKGLIDIPVPCENAIEQFAGNVPELWTYYCCGQFRDELPNRFFCMPSIRNRILGVLLYKYNCKGFLQWGFNFYFTQHSVRPVDPFTETDAGGAFPSGDAFIVYPGENGEPLPSLRQKVFYDGIQDIGALTALEKKTSRDEVLALIGSELGDINFSSYPLDEERLLAFEAKLRSLL